MKKTNLFLLGLGYIAGLAVAVRFGKDGKKKTLEAIGEDIKEVHKNLFNEAEEVIFSEENKARIAELKEKLSDELAEFRTEAKARIAELKKQGIEKKSDVEDEIKALYARREAILSDLKKKAIDALGETKETSSDLLKSLQAKIEDIYSDLTAELEEIYQDIKKKLK